MTENRFVLDTNAALYLLKSDTVPEPYASTYFALSVITRCIIAATAIALNIPLLTHDNHLLGLSWQSFTVRDFVLP